MPSRWKTSGLSGSRRARRRASASAIGCEMGRIRPTNVFERASTEDFQEAAERRYLDLTQSYGIASVTTTATNPLMWSYYAAGHTGIVVGIDTMRFMQQPFRAPMFPLNVEYARDFPVANSTRTTTSILFGRLWAQSPTIGTTKRSGDGF